MATHRKWQLLRRIIACFLKEVLLKELKWIRALKKDPIYQEVVATRDKLMAEKGYDWLESTQLAIHERRFLLNRLFKEQQVPGE